MDAFLVPGAAAGQRPFLWPPPAPPPGETRGRSVFNSPDGHGGLFDDRQNIHQVGLPLALPPQKPALLTHPATTQPHPQQQP